MKKIIDIDERFLEAARAALAKKMPWEKTITAKQTVNAALSFYAAYYAVTQIKRGKNGFSTF